MKIRYKLFGSYLVIVLVLLAASLAVNSNIEKMVSLNKELTNNYNIKDFSTTYGKGARNVQVGVYLYVTGDKDTGMQLRSKGTETMRLARNNLKSAVTDPGMLSDLAEIQVKEEKVADIAGEVILIANGSAANRQAQLDQKLDALESQVEALNLLLAGFENKTNRNMANSTAASNLHGDETKDVTFYAIIGSVIVSMILAIIMSSFLTRPLATLTNVANRVSRGDIMAKVDVESSDEIGELASSFKRMVNAFKIMDALLKEK